MKRIITIILLAFSVSSYVNAQSVTGVVQDATDQTNISNATLKLLKADSTATPFLTLSNNRGMFIMRNVPSGNYILSVTSVGYGDYRKNILVGPEGANLGNIAVPKAAVTLEDIVISGAPPPVRQRDDTLEFAASQYKVNPDATGEDLIKKVPGITVDRSGNVTAGGETVNKVTVDGRDFFGDDATATLRNLPSEVIDKIQVFDRLSDQAQLTGFDDGNTTKSINIVTKKTCAPVISDAYS